MRAARIEQKLFLTSSVAIVTIIAGPGRFIYGITSRAARMIVDNNITGDPNGLFQPAHHVLCRTLEFLLIIGSHLPAEFSIGHDAGDSADRARALLAIIKLDGNPEPVAG